MRKLFLIFLITILLNGCGYNSIYTNNKKINFTISSLEIKGDTDINYILKRKLEQYTSGGDEKNFEINISTNYSKNPISKDKKGEIKLYRLVANLNLRFKIEGKVQDISITETFQMENYEDEFEENKYEKNIKRNLADIMLNKVISYLSNYK